MRVIIWMKHLGMIGSYRMPWLCATMRSSKMCDMGLCVAGGAEWSWVGQWRVTAWRRGAMSPHPQLLWIHLGEMEEVSSISQDLLWILLYSQQQHLLPWIWHFRAFAFERRSEKNTPSPLFSFASVKTVCNYVAKGCHTFRKDDVCCFPDPAVLVMFWKTSELTVQRM